MRWQVKILFVAVCGMVVLGLAVGEAPMQFGGVGNIKKDSPDPVALMHHPVVKNNLKLTREQLDHVDKALWALLKSTLSEEQYKRLKEIDLQQRDYRAFTDSEVQAQLGLNGEQKEGINIILTDCDKEIANQEKILKQPGLPADKAKEAQEHIKAQEREAKGRCIEVLTAEQKQIWDGMLGEFLPGVDFSGPRTFTTFDPAVGGKAIADKGAAKAKGGAKKGKAAAAAAVPN